MLVSTSSILPIMVVTLDGIMHAKPSKNELLNEESFPLKHKNQD